MLKNLKAQDLYTYAWLVWREHESTIAGVITLGFLAAIGWLTLVVI
jgi:hypothetical protein